MSTFFNHLFNVMMKAGFQVTRACRAGMMFALHPIFALVLRAVRKGNRAAARLVHAIRRFLYIGRRYGYKRATRLTAYQLEKMLRSYSIPLKQGLVRLAPMALAAVVLMVSISCWTKYTMAYEVNYDGKNVGYVTSEAVFEDACQLVNDRMVEDEFNAKEPTYSLTVVSASAVNNADEICEKIIETTDEYQTAVGVYVDDVLTAVCSDQAKTKEAIEQITAKYAKKGQDNYLSFVNQIEYVSGLYPVAMIDATDGVEALSDALTVMTTTTETSKKVIPFETKGVKSDDHYIGHRQVETKGANGVKEITAKVSYVNGKQVEKTVLSEKVIKKAVTEVIVVGNKKFSSASATDTGENLFWPVEGTGVGNVSSYFGDGRNHKGTDILAPNGTAIFAAEAGTVTYVGWESGYGYYMEINHGNGLSTLYSHCSSITAKQGQTVARGEYIAAIGITGRATAYHLHFEVQENNTAVDARPYLGIN